MKSLTEHLWFEVLNRRGFVNITGTMGIGFFAGDVDLLVNEIENLPACYLI